MAELVVGRVVSMEGGKPVLQRYPTVSPANGAKIAALIVAARGWKQALRKQPDRFSTENDQALQILLAAAEAIE